MRRWSYGNKAIAEQTYIMTQQQIHLRANRARRLQKQIIAHKCLAAFILKQVDPNQQNLDVIQNQISRLAARQSQLV